MENLKNHIFYLVSISVKKMDKTKNSDISNHLQYSSTSRSIMFFGILMQSWRCLFGGKVWNKYKGSIS